MVVEVDKMSTLSRAVDPSLTSVHYQGNTSIFNSNFQHDDHFHHDFINEAYSNSGLFLPLIFLFVHQWIIYLLQTLISLPIEIKIFTISPPEDLKAIN